MRKNPRVHSLSELSFARVPLEDFLHESLFVERMLDTRWRVIREFTESKERRPGKNETKTLPTPGVISQVSENISELAACIEFWMGEGAKSRIYSADDLPRSYQNYGSDRKVIAHYVRVELILRTLLMFRETHDLWYYNNEWVIPQTLQDEYLQRFKEAKQNFHDARHFHGRHNGWRARGRELRQAPGVSVGASR